MAATSANEDNISLRVMVHKQENKVIFAEADSNFVDTLFSLMTLPMATIVRLMKKCHDQNLKALGSFTNLYQSRMDLSLSHFSKEESKFMMLNPRTSSFDHCRKLQLKIDDTEPIANYFICRNVSCSQRVGPFFSTCNFDRCSYCGALMDRESKYEASTVHNTGQVACFDGSVFVCDGLTFIITDDLRVMPKTSDSNILLLGGLGITDASQLEERTLDNSLQQILTLLKSALLFKNPLTELVFPGTHHSRYLVDQSQGSSVQNLVSNETGTNAKKMKLKVALQKSTSKFLFAEADEDFVELVFGFLEIPLGTVIRKLKMNGSTSIDGFGNLFTSISNMKVGNHIKSHDLKDMLLNPQLEQKSISQHQIFPLNVANSSQDHQGRCAHRPCSKKTWRRNSTKRHLIKLSYSSQSIPQTIISDTTESKDSRVQESFLKASVKFMVTDDLVITPLSFVSAIAVLNKLNVLVDDVEEHELSIGGEEGVKILEAGLRSSSTLSDALLNGKKFKL
ncbi:uncharacterized protein LOC112500020 [Cynara cardunculus var. scolymus]|uniref:uncharacterized protein LOC112500020 n=1 Tax=Cynara cardunculus var. scolymus TaxID=59895 RepID=UPI000D62DDFD|nr:uncharacterized protein LOC112500020 [Cynara cardunculus var. scolymus]